MTSLDQYRDATPRVDANGTVSVCLLALLVILMTALLWEVEDMAEFYQANLQNTVDACMLRKSDDG